MSQSCRDACNSARNIALIDDSSTMLLSLQLLLKPIRDCEIRAFAEPRRSIVSDIAEWADLVVVDLVMPKISGVELIKDLRSRRVFGSRPILAVSGAVFESLRIQALEAGADVFVKKPIDPVAFRRLVVRMLDQSGAYSTDELLTE